MKNFVYFIVIFGVSVHVTAEESKESSDPGVFKEQSLGKNQFGYDFAIQYRNLRSSRPGLIEDVVKVGNDFIPIVRFIGEGEVNLDSLIFSPKVNYGLNNKTSLFSGLNYVTTNRRGVTSLGTMETTDSYISDISVGLNHRLSFENGITVIGTVITPIFQFDSITNEGLDFSIGDAATFSIAASKVVDSIIVLGVEGSYKYASERNIDGINYDFPNTLSITPSFKFVITPKVTAYTSFTWQRVDPTTINGDNAQDIVRTNLNAGFGLDYTLTKRMIVSLGLDNNVSGDEGANVMLRISYF